MALSLTSGDRTRFENTAKALLSPLEAADQTQACASALEPLVELFGIDRAAFLLPDGDGLRIHSKGFDAEAKKRLTTVHAGASAGTNLYAYTAVARVMACLHERHIKVWDMRLAERVSGVALKETAFYHDIACPSGLNYHAAAGISLARGKAVVGIACDDPESGRFGCRDRLTVLRMLYPAIEAGIHALWNYAHRRDTLTRALDGTSDGLMVCNADGRELHRNRTLRRFLADDPAANVLLTVMRRSAEQLVNLRGAAPTSDRLRLPPPGMRDVKTAFSHYSVRANFLAPGLFASDWAILVSLERSRPELPSAEDLRRRFNLTERETEVALLLARGRSNAQIAERISRSEHTVRHHVEHVFRKLGIRSRKALALRLLGDAG